jgi:ribosomal protein S18 acetylase RimI-like enzyme
MADLSISYKEHATPEEETVLLEGLIADAAKAKGMSPITPFAFIINDDNGKVLGGAKGATLYGCLYVDLLWIDPSLRKQGWGRKLMQEAENLGKKRKCTFATVNTMDWEALPFYQSLGYQIEYVGEGFEKNSKMYALRKSLT